MAVRPFSKEELNFFKFASIVHDEFPKMLRSTFVALWDRKIAPLPGYQVWDDSPAVRTLLLTLEGGKTPIPTNKSFKDWDCTALFQATIYSKTFGGSTKTTLSDQFIRGKKPSTFHSSLTSLTSTGNQDEIITLAIDQVRLLRNCLCHSPESILKKHDFDYYVKLAKDAFVATGFSTDQVDHIGNLKESDFPTERVNELNRKIKAVVLESKKFLEERVEKGITKLTDGQESVIQKLDEINRNVIRNQNSNAATMQENRGFAALGALGPAVNNDECIITFKITAEKVRLVKDIGLGTVTLIDIFNACTKAHPSVFQDALKRGFGDEKDDQKFGEISQGCLLVPLHCLTDERFLEVLDDFESGRLKKRLLTEFSQIGVEIEGLEIEIKNMKEVNKRKENIKGKLQEFSAKFVKYRQGIVNVQGTDRQSHLKSCIPDKPELFIRRDTIVNQIVSSLVDDACGIVSIVGGPGFGKSTVAIEVSHHLISKERDIVVIFSFLSQAFTIPEVITRLCHDVGVIPGEDPKSSLMFWLKSIEDKVVLVMDNIEQLLERHVKHSFLELVRTLRKNSQQHIQILTTSRTEFSISETQTKFQIGEMDETTCIELLEKCCPVEVEKAFLSQLAELCGFVPLALCIAGTLIDDPDDLSELIQWLKEKPMEALRNSDQCVERAIQFSFQKLCDEEQKDFVCLSVFHGDFHRESAEEVMEKTGVKTQHFLSNLVNRSLLQCRGDKRFVIHSLIRRFLADCDRFHGEKANARSLMVSHFLKMCHELTKVSYTRDRFTSARETLKKDIHNVEETLKICSQDPATNPNTIILESLASSDIYMSSYRFFHTFSWDLLPEAVLGNFFESCSKLARKQEQVVIEILFQCLIADQEGRKSSRDSPEYASQIGILEAAFHKYELDLKDDRFVFMFCYELITRYHFNTTQNNQPADLPYKNLSFLPESKELSLEEKVAEAYILKKRGNICKLQANKLFRKDDKKYEEYMNSAKSIYNEALSLAQNALGDHELTCSLHKLLGDLYFNMDMRDEALACYTHAINLHKKLQLDSNEQFVMLLKNLGGCLSFSGRFEKSVEKLSEALDIANKITEENAHFKALVYYELAKTCSSWKPECQKAVEYAEKAMKMQKLRDPRKTEELREIIEKAEVVKKFINSLRDIVNVEETDRLSQLKSRIPDKPQTFIGRDSEVKQIISSLVENGCGIVSIVGGAGFGKTTVAVEVSHHLSNDHNIAVFFSSLSNASSVADVKRRLCRDVGVIAGKHPDKSLTFWLKSIKKKVVLVMDGIEQMPKGDFQSKFTKLVLSLRKHSQILTTSRIQFPVSEKTVNYQTEELDVTYSVELLRKCCPDVKVEDAYLFELAKLCGFVPLALCIAGTLIPDLVDPSELIHLFKEKPVKGLRNPNQCIQQAIWASFQNLRDEERKALVCLSVFVGNFQSSSAKEVVNKSGVEVENLLECLVRRSLVQEIGDERYVIHWPIKRFLAEHDQFQDERKMAQELMLKHFLKLCHSLTMDGYLYNGYTSARESLRKDIHNIEKTLKLCTEDEARVLGPNIAELVTSSDIYNSSCRFFCEFSWDLFHPNVLTTFLESCVKLAQRRKQPAIEMAFRCLVQDQSRHTSGRKSPEYTRLVDVIAKESQKNDALWKEDRSLFILCHYIFSLFDSDKPTNEAPPDLPEDDLQPLNEDKSASPIAKAGEAYFLLARANLNKRRGIKVSKAKSANGDSYEYFKKAETLYNKALALAKELLGDHEFTCRLHLQLGDLYLVMHDNTKAIMCFTDYIIRRKKLELYFNETFVYFLKKCGSCLAYLRYFNASVTKLKEARDLAGEQTRCRALLIYQLAKTYNMWKPGCCEAVEFANEALEMRELLKSEKMVKTLEKILQIAEKNTASLLADGNN